MTPVFSTPTTAPALAPATIEDPTLRTLEAIEQALVALPTKRLIAGVLCITDFLGHQDYCALGALARARNWPFTQVIMHRLDADGMDRQACADIMRENDRAGFSLESPEDRYTRVLAWVRQRILDVARP